MKTVGQQLQEARLAKNWTPEMAARETKIKVDRVRDLEADDYSNFTSPTYARGFVRTYARLLGLDEYKILRQLDTKLPEDDTANIVTDTGVAYLPETSLPPRAAHRDYTGLYIVMALGGIVTLISTFVIFQAYRVGELSRYFASNTDATATSPIPASTNAPPASVAAEPPARALPVDSNTPPPIAETPDPNAPPKALPVDPNAVPPATTNTVASADIPEHAVRALPVDPAELAAAPPPGPPVGVSSVNPPTPSSPPAPASGPVVMPSAPPRALPVSAAELAAAAADPTTAPPVPSAPAASTPPPAISTSARPSNSGPAMEPTLPAVAPTTVAADTTAPSADGSKPLVLTASQDSFVRVTDLDNPDSGKPLYAAVLHSGDSVAFSGRKFSINVGVPSAVDIKLDGVNYGPHSDGSEPETFTVQSHLP